MNNPARSVAKEIHRIAEDGFDFVDLTLEPPNAWPSSGREIGRLVRDLGLSAVGHTAWHLPLASPFPDIAALARQNYARALDVFAEAEVRLVNVHPDPRMPLNPADRVRARNAEVIAALCEDAATREIRVMVENIDRTFAEAEEMRVVLDAVPDAALHLDVGHANLRLGARERNRTASFLEAFGDRLAHVHVSDNFGGTDDLHLPLGAGNIDWRSAIRALKGAGYDGTVTLEIFAREREHLRVSRRLWLQWWSDTT